MNDSVIDSICHDPMEKKRQEHIKELIMTEQAYIEDMRLVHEVFFLSSFSLKLSLLSRFIQSQSESVSFFLSFFTISHLLCISAYLGCHDSSFI